MIMLCFYVYYDVMYDDEYDYEFTFMTLFIIAKQVSFSHVRNNMMIWWATLFYAMSRLYVIRFNKWNISLNNVSYHPHK